MRKQPRQRYSSAASMAEDLRRVLAGDTVNARRGSRWYRLRRTFYRHRVAAMTSLALLVVLVASLTLRLHQLAAERDRATAVAGFLGGLITDLDPGSRNTYGATRISVVEVLDAGRARLRVSDLQPAIRAQLLVKLATNYNSLFADRKAEAAARDALSLDTGNNLPDSLRLEARLALAAALTSQHRYQEAEAQFHALQELAAGNRQWRGRIIMMHGAAMLAAGHLPEARNMLQTAISDLDTEGDAKSMILALRLLANAEYQMGNNAPAQEAALRALQLNQSQLSGQRIMLAKSEDLYATMLRTSDPKAAEPHMRRALSELRKLLGSNNRDVLSAQNNYALLLRQLHRPAEAELLLRNSLEGISRDPLGNEHTIAMGWQNLAAILCEQRKYDQCIDAARRASDGFDASLPPEHYLRAYPLLTVAEAQLASGKPQAARTSLLAAQPLLQAALKKTALPRQILEARLAMTYAASGQCDETLPVIRQVFSRLRGTDRVRFGKEFARAFEQCQRPVPETMTGSPKGSSAASTRPD